MAGRSFLIPLILLLCSLFHTQPAVSELPRIQHPISESEVNILVIGDWGRRGAFNQSQVAFQMGRIGEEHIAAYCSGPLLAPL